MPKRKQKTVKRSELSNIKMTCGNENKYSYVILDSNIEHWVGIGWLTEREAIPEDYKKYPVVED